MTPLLEGRHVRLEPLALRHLDALWEAVSEGGETFRRQAMPRTRDQQAFATVDRAANRVAGSTRFLDLQRWTWPIGLADPRVGDASVVDALEIGFTWLAPRAQHSPGADGGVRDTAFFAIVAAEWPEAKARLAARLR